MRECDECGVYCDEGEASCTPTDTAHNVPDLALVPVLSEDNDICTQGSIHIEFGSVLCQWSIKPSEPLAIVELYHSRAGYITGQSDLINLRQYDE
jgi:hypothetical protein